MTDFAKMARLMRLAKTVDTLRSVEELNVAKLSANRKEVSEHALQLDALDVSTSLAWQLFPDEVLLHRSRLMERQIQLETAINNSQDSARRFRTLSEHLGEIHMKTRALLLQRSDEMALTERAATTASARKQLQTRFQD